MFSLYSKSQEERALLPPRLNVTLYWFRVQWRWWPLRFLLGPFLYFPLPHAKNKVRGFYAIAEE